MAHHGDRAATPMIFVAHRHAMYRIPIIHSVMVETTDWVEDLMDTRRFSMQQRPVRLVGFVCTMLLIASLWPATPALALSGVYHNPYGNDDLYATEATERSPRAPWQATRSTSTPQPGQSNLAKLSGSRGPKTVCPKRQSVRHFSTTAEIIRTGGSPWARLPVATQFSIRSMPM